MTTAKKKENAAKAVGKQPVKRKHGFQPGQSGNPKGRPPKSKDQREFEALCKQKSAQAFEEIMKFVESSSMNKLKLDACKLVLEYAYGKPKQLQVIEGSAVEGGIRLVAEIDTRTKSK